MLKYSTAEIWVEKFRQKSGGWSAMLSKNKTGQDTWTSLAKTP
jgi:hypothetical protein